MKLLTKLNKKRKPHCRLQKTGDNHVFIQQKKKKTTVALVDALDFHSTARLQNTKKRSKRVKRKEKS